MSEPELLPPAQWYASLAKSSVACAALITDAAGRVLLVKPNYRRHWLFVGGWLDEGESPHQACAREVTEELGVELDIGRLLLVDWAPPRGERVQPVLYFIFDCEPITDVTELSLQNSELDEFRFMEPDEAVTHLIDPNTRRLPAALEARKTGQTLYLPQTLY